MGVGCWSWWIGGDIWMFWSVWNKLSIDFMPFAEKNRQLINNLTNFIPLFILYSISLCYDLEIGAVCSRFLKEAVASTSNIIVLQSLIG